MINSVSHLSSLHTQPHLRRLGKRLAAQVVRGQFAQPQNLDFGQVVVHLGHSQQQVFELRRVRARAQRLLLGNLENVAQNHVGFAANACDGVDKGGGGGGRDDEGRWR